MFSVAAIRETRYCDIVSSSRAARTSMHHPAGELREVQRRLAGRVRRADDVHVLAGALARLARGRAVVDAAHAERLEAGRLEPPVRHTGGDQHRARLDLALAAAAAPPSRTARTGPRLSNPTTSRASTISAPKREAWATARWVRSAPESPLGKPR